MRLVLAQALGLGQAHQSIDCWLWDLATRGSTAQERDECSLKARADPHSKGLALALPHFSVGLSAIDPV